MVWSSGRACLGGLLAPPRACQRRVVVLRTRAASLSAFLQSSLLALRFAGVGWMVGWLLFFLLPLGWLVGPPRPSFSVGWLVLPARCGRSARRERSAPNGRSAALLPHSPSACRVRGSAGPRRRAGSCSGWLVGCSSSSFLQAGWLFGLLVRWPPRCSGIGAHWGLRSLAAALAISFLCEGFGWQRQAKVLLVLALSSSQRGWRCPSALPVVSNVCCVRGTQRVLFGSATVLLGLL